MLEHWSQLGFVVAQVVGGDVEYVEDERSLAEPAPLV
jgi:hypothetical protein